MFWFPNISSPVSHWSKGCYFTSKVENFFRFMKLKYHSSETPTLSRDYLILEVSILILVMEFVPDAIFPCQDCLSECALKDFMIIQTLFLLKGGLWQMWELRSKESWFTAFWGGGNWQLARSRGGKIEVARSRWQLARVSFCCSCLEQWNDLARTRTACRSVLKFYIFRKKWKRLYLLKMIFACIFLNSASYNLNWEFLECHIYLSGSSNFFV